MYKFFINERLLVLLSPTDALPFTEGDNTIVVKYYGSKREFFPYLDMFEKGSPRVNTVALRCPDLAQAKEDFLSLLKIQEAGGGVVRNPEGKILAMFRRGWWDLPKGKIDPGETPSEAALREVEEETGIGGLALGAFLGHSYHVFRNKKNERTLKLTHWYSMSCDGGTPTPQAEEDIEEVLWLNKEELLGKERLYNNIRELLALA